MLNSEKIGRVTGFVFLGSKITMDGDCSHEIKRCLLFGRKVMTNLDKVLKSRDISLLMKVHIVRAMFFLVLRYRCESWIIKKAAWERIDAFELWCWRRLFRVSYTARRSNQSVLKEINPEYSLEGLCLDIWCEETTHWKWPWCWERLRAWGEGGNRGWDDSLSSLSQWPWVCANCERQWRIGKPGMLQSVGLQIVRHNWVTKPKQ